MPLTFGIPDTELTLTLANRRPELVDNIFRGTAFLAALRAYGGIETVNGGNEIVRAIRMSKNATASSFDGYDTLDTGMTVH